MSAAKWVGYLEHKTPDMLGYFNENVGKGYCTIFAAMLWEAQRVNLMGLPWCATFVHAVIGRPEILGRAHPGCRVLARRMKRRKLWRGKDYFPNQGDIIFLANDGKRIDHCGIVESYDGTTVISIEGNAIDPSGVFSPNQGGAVARRERLITDPKIIGFACLDVIKHGN